MAHDPSLSTAAAALHALEEHELAALDAHAANCAECTTELAEFRETAARLGAATSQTPPATMRENVLARIGEIRQLPPEVEVTDEFPAVEDDAAENALPEPVSLETRRRTPRRTWLLAAAAVVAVMAAVGAMFVIGRSTEQADPLRECVATAPDQRELKTTPDSVGASDTTVSASCGAALVQLSEIPEPPEGHTYQLWVIAGDQARSVGTMVPDTAGTMPTVVAPVHVGDTAIGVTVEPEGGSPAPTSDPVVVLPLV